MAKKVSKKQGGRTSPVKSGNSGKTDAVNRRRTKVFAAFIALALVVVLVGGLGVVAWRDKQIESRDVQKVEAQRDPLEICIADVESTLETITGTARVYDVKGNVIFTLTDSTGAVGVSKAPENVVTLMRDRIAGGQVSKINLDKWSKSHTTLGSLGEDVTESDLIKGSLGWAAVNYWCANTKTMLSDDAKIIIGAGLDAKFKTEELTKYCLASASFGGVQGITRASEVIFGKPINELNSNQQDYLMYSFENSAASFQEFIEQNPTKAGSAKTAEEFGIASVGDPYWLLRSKVTAELRSIVGDDMATTDYNVKLRIDPQVQSTMQSAIDSTMQASISLGSNGQTVMDGTAVCIDAHTGFITGLVGGRSVNSIASPLEFPTANNIGNFEKAKEMLEGDTELTYNTLISYETLSGDTECASFGGIVNQGQLGVIGNPPVLENTVKLDKLAEFFTDLYVDSGMRLIEQVTTQGGANVYTAPAANDVSLEGVNPDLRCLINGNTTAQGVDYIQYANTGIALATASSEVIICGMYGTGSLGYALSDSDYNMCVNTATTLLDGVLKCYPKEPATVDPSGTVYAKAEKAQESNASFVTEIFDAWVTELSGMEINSPESASEFQQAFEYYGQMIGTYVGVVSDDLIEEYSKKLESIRSDRADELVQYAS